MNPENPPGPNDVVGTGEVVQMNGEVVRITFYGDGRREEEVQP